MTVSKMCRLAIYGGASAPTASGEHANRADVDSLDQLTNADQARQKYHFKWVQVLTRV
jgi:hypothetical protein